MDGAEPCSPESIVRPSGAWPSPDDAARLYETTVGCFVPFPSNAASSDPRDTLFMSSALAPIYDIASLFMPFATDVASGFRFCCDGCEANGTIRSRGDTVELCCPLIGVHAPIGKDLIG